ELLFTYRLPGPRYIEMLTPDQAIRILVDRDAGRAWKYPAPQLRLAAVKPRLPLPAATETLVFEELDDMEGAPARSTGRYVVAGEDLSAKATFTVPVPRFPADPLLTAAADRAVAVAFTEGSYSLRLFSLSDGRELASLPLPVPAGRQLSVRWIEESPVRVGDELGVELAAYDDAGGEVKVLRTWLPWSGDWPEALAGDFDAPRSVFFDLDGSTQLIQRSLRDLPAYALGGGETWPAVEVADRLGQPRARIRSASLIYGDVPPPWRFSGPWFFTLTASVTTEGSGFDRVGYTAWNVETLDSLSIELPPPSGSQWYDSNQVRGPIPDPRNPGVVALGRTEVAHLDLGTANPTGRLIKHVRANVTSTSGADHLDPWSGNPGELVFALGHGGHDGGWPGAMIAPKVERPPFDDRMKFRVARAGDCLNLRDGPSLSSRITNCIPDGTELVPWEDASGATQAGRTFERNEDGAWVAVRLPDGTSGWVSSAYLDWG
ncbi:MAG TPA: SH3 domain-containing protein, partial [Tepidiformaceae bacterium]|nr:SH3 domain-containing protein [Tepidiformaceae bacterium]